MRLQSKVSARHLGTCLRPLLTLAWSFKGFQRNVKNRGLDKTSNIFSMIIQNDHFATSLPPISPQTPHLYTLPGSTGNLQQHPVVCRCLLPPDHPTATGALHWCWRRPVAHTTMPSASARTRDAGLGDEHGRQVWVETKGEGKCGIVLGEFEACWGDFSVAVVR
eukprot:364617-Chlamydomonas_euryale.AAC.6